MGDSFLVYGSFQIRPGLFKLQGKNPILEKSPEGKDFLGKHNVAQELDCTKSS
jgi:hypothetical protein